MKTYKILVVDDEPNYIETIINCFENKNYQIIIATDGEAGCQIAKNEKPNLIIMDWEMPKMNGIESIKKIKKDPSIKDIPIIMATGKMLSSIDLQVALEAGAVDYIRKPIDKIELIARTRANLHLSENYKKIKELNEVKDNVFAVISHDLRGPIGTVKAFTELILDKSTNYNYEQIMQFTQVIGKQSSSVLNILEDLLAWANCQQNNVIYSPKKQNLLLALQDNIELLEETAKQKKIEIINKISPDIIVNYDLNLISTVIRNLISNAIKFTPELGTISITAKKNDDNIEVSVIDTGVGISAERINNIFSNTSYETTFGTNAEKGSGLGLKLCKDFVKKHNGEIWVESKLNKGSHFIFTLPIN